MKRHFLLSAILTLFISQLVVSQALFRKNYSYGGLASMGIPAGIVEGITPNTYVLAGSHVSFSIPLLSGIISKLDASGNVVWSNKYFDNAVAFNLTDIKKDAVNNQYYLCGGSDSDDAIFLVIDDNGNIVLDTKFSISEAKGAIFNRARKTSDGGYIVVGAVSNYDPDGSGPEIKFHSHSYVDENQNPGGGTEDIYSPLIVKLDQNGKEVWHKIFRFYKNSGKAPADAIKNSGQFKGVVEVNDGYVAVGTYKINDWQDAQNGNGDETATDAIILKTTKSGSITYLKQIDNPSTSRSQSSKTLNCANLTSAGDVLAAGGDDGKELIQKYQGVGNSFSNLISRNFEYGGGFFGASTNIVSQIFEVQGSNDIATMGMYLGVGLPPVFANTIHRMNSNATSTVWNKEYDFSMGAILPNGSMTSGGGYVFLSESMSVGGFKYQVIRTDQNGAITSTCKPGDLSPTPKSGPSTYATPYYKSWTSTPVSKDANVVKTTLTPTVDVKCIKNTCTPPAKPTSVTANDICSGGSTTIQASGTGTNVHYNVYDAASGGNYLGSVPFSVSPTTTTTYYVETVRNGDTTCASTSRVSVTVNVSSGFTVNFTNITNVTCHGGSDGSVTASATGGQSPYDYSWDNTGNITQTLNGIKAGKHPITVTDDLGCVSQDTVTITESDSIEISVVNSVDPSCGTSDGKIEVSAIGGTGTLQYQWDDPNNQTGKTASNLPAGAYTVTVTDDNNCQNQKTITLSNLNGPSVIIDDSTAVSCYGSTDGSATVSVSGGQTPYTYSWDNGETNGTATQLSSGSHTVTVTDGNGCSSSDLVHIDSPDSISISVDNIVDASCGNSDGSATVSAIGGTGTLQYQWDDPNNQTGKIASNLPAGAYTVTVTDGNNCQNKRVITIDNNLNLNPTISGVSGTTCYGDKTGSATITIANPNNYTISWDDGEQGVTATKLTAGTHTVTISDSQGCSVTETVTIPGPTTPITANAIVQPSDCGKANGSIELNVTGGNNPYTFSWSDGNTSNKRNNLVPGNYNVTITDDKGCSVDTTYHISQNGGIAVDAQPPLTVIHKGESVNLIAITVNGSSDYVYSWEPPVGLSCTDCQKPIATPSKTTQYVVTVTDKDGCSGKDTLLIVVEKQCGKIYVPNIFSPNNDGFNDLFRISGDCISKFHLQIFDRWGEVIFESNDISICWDGTYKDEKLNTGAYVYKLDIVNDSGKRIQKSGSIDLIR